MTRVGKIDEVVDDYLTKTAGNDGNGFNLDSGILYYSNNIKVKSVRINGANDYNISIDKNKILKIDLTVEVSTPVHAYLVINIMSEEKVIAGFSSAAVMNHVYVYESGEFVMSEAVELPTNLTNGDYDLRIKVLDRYTGLLINIPRLATLTKNDFYSEFTNMQFTHSNSGYFVLKGLKI